MVELLTGTVTFLFTDIEGSTRLLREHGDAWPALLERHRQLLREAFAARDGREMGTEGDSFFVAFPTAPGAVAAAAAAQRALSAEPWPEGVAIRVRIGMHTGEASVTATGYAGLHVHRASRVSSVAHGGQVLLSDPTRVLVEQDLPDGVALRDLGEHRLKDLERPEHLWQLVIDGLPNEFPAIRSLDVTPNNLPVRVTTFLGRERELDDVARLLRERRLVTLTGPGGTGKTRLSLELAERSLGRFPDGVFFVALAPIPDADLVAPTISRTLALPEQGTRSAEERLVDHIGERRMLLVLDNFEQVVDAGPLVGRLVAACPNLRVVLSSRSALRVTGEQEYPVPALELPDPEHQQSVSQLAEYTSVALFVDRARAVKPDFRMTDENAAAVAEICIRLDGLPLAIELAAARVRVLTPQAMLGRLEHRLSLLSAGARDVPARQQTLRGAIAWSHDMLDEADRALFAGLSVFVSGASLEAIEEVCGPELSGRDVMDSLESLVEKSLLRQGSAPSGEARFTMLETIREFAIEQAVERGSPDALRTRHAAWFAGLAREAAPQLMGAGASAWLARLDQDQDNLRSALTWLIESGATEEALRLGASLWRYWQMRGQLVEGFERIRAALALPDAAAHPAARADALSAAGGLAYWLADTERAVEMYEREIEARAALGDRAGLAEAEYGLSFVYATGTRVVSEGVSRAYEHMRTAEAIFTEIGDERGVGRCQWALANAAWAEGRVDEARERSGRALAIFESVGDRFHAGWASYTLALASLGTPGAFGDADAVREAGRLLAGALRTFAESGDVAAYTLIIDALAILALREGRRERAARLSGAVASLERLTGAGLNAFNRNVLGFDPSELRSDPGLAGEWEAGTAMSAAEAAAYALEDG